MSLASRIEVVKPKKLGKFTIYEREKDSLIIWNESHQIVLPKNNMFSKLANADFDEKKLDEISDLKVTYNHSHGYDVEFFSKTYKFDKAYSAWIERAELSVKHYDYTRFIQLRVTDDDNRNIYVARINVEKCEIGKRLIKNPNNPDYVFKDFLNNEMLIYYTHENLYELRIDLADSEEKVFVYFEKDEHSYEELKNKIKVHHDYLNKKEKKNRRRRVSVCFIVQI